MIQIHCSGEVFSDTVDLLSPCSILSWNVNYLFPFAWS